MPLLLGSTFDRTANHPQQTLKDFLLERGHPCKESVQNWSAANGGVTDGGLRGVCPPVLEIGRSRPFSSFFCLFRPFPEGPESTWKIQKTGEKGLFPQISSDVPKNLLRLFFASKLFLFSEVIFQDPPKISFKTSIKITSRGYFYFLRLFLPREVISKK